MVFDKASVPRHKEDFMRWYDIQTEWSEEQNYSDISITTDKLRLWYYDIIDSFAPLEEYSHESEILHSKHSAEYVIGENIIYCAFDWSDAQEAYAICLMLAEKHELGFFDVSSEEGSVFMSGKLIY